MIESGSKAVMHLGSKSQSWEVRRPNCALFITALLSKISLLNSCNARLSLSLYHYYYYENAKYNRQDKVTAIENDNARNYSL